MPGLRENINDVLNVKKTDERKDKVIAVNQAEGYSERSSVLRAYRAELIPADHQILLRAIRQELGDGVKEGIIQLEKVLQATGYKRASALKMLKHMRNFGVIDTKPGYRSTWVKLLKD